MFWSSFCAPAQINILPLWHIDKQIDKFALYTYYRKQLFIFGKTTIKI